MLDKLIPSKVRRKILSLFYHQIDGVYYLREIVRKTDEEVNAVKRELDILFNAKVLLRERRTNKVFYSLNKNYALFDELLRIHAKDTKLAQLIIENQSMLGKVKFVAISMKFSKKISIKEDEIYILFVGVIVIPEVEAIMTTARREFGWEINFTVMTEDELSFRKKNNDPFIWKFLKYPKVMLVGQESELIK